ncbi:SDR family NAD(P)-dependent oxidoreductase [Gordonia pseudamarae]|jgi:dehydrogenase/reductase SDR family protein 1|uniref:SDR family NAD(P)-dependent oxidoreductase n=1 Tax=Gordonia pseudamarae TaxID=2831662 RepID=A0ABX6IIQ3_9ACTN|nr:MULTISPECIES: SDR family NAD(P)-dependent oxidoreductase [Gordonia]MBD0020870.1 SDR family NAD(P)-dependent oxidoreductase [Gordonia sp. (in: high G+C Gram-positive bacteria)]QHN26263.1 SDR family NAD(P)-dependent oxidoreductase [Gordonia pseudamarae]QHN35155.1 SDR family NAD(P)-dependent oxidoreductase [Gordonia pseudamarae]
MSTTSPAPDRVALVTGASRGVGLGVATALRDAGWRVYGTSRRGSGPTGIVNLPVDHADDDAVAAAFAQIADEAGHLDLLVNNAWASPRGFAGFTAKFYERPISDWDSLIGIGLRSHYVAAVHAAALMVPRGSGLIASTSSFGSRGHLHSVLYGMGKTALDKMAYDMGHELTGTGVTAVSLWLGLIRTPLLLGSGLTEFAGFPVDRAEDPEFVGRVVAALADDPDLGRQNGHTIVTAEYGAEHGITNNDSATVPDSHRPAFGGGPLFPPATEPIDKDRR